MWIDSLYSYGKEYYMKKKRKKKSASTKQSFVSQETATISQHEDHALKVTAQFF